MLVTKVGNILEEIDVLKDDNVSSEIFVIQIMFRNLWSAMCGSTVGPWFSLWSSNKFCLDFDIQFTVGCRFPFSLVF